MNEEYLKLVNEFIEGSDLTEVEISAEDFSIKILKSAKQTSATPMEAFETKENKTKEKEFFEVLSPAPGRFLRADTPSHPPLAVVGSKVKAGQKVGVIEALSVRKDVISGVEGTVVQVLVENNEFVEYNQPLMFIKPGV